MIKIKNILICGLGGVGTVCATSIYENKEKIIKILVDEKRIKKYKQEKTTFNNKEYDFEYIMPSYTQFKADLIIISTKNDGLDEAINNIKNFIHEHTIIISLLNGIHSEKKIRNKYPNNFILTSFYIGDSCIRTGRNIKMEGNYTIFIGGKEKNQLEIIDKFLTETGINHQVSNDIMERYWKKFMINVGLNQICTVENKTFKEIKQEPKLVERMKKLIWEVKLLAEKEGINNPEKLYEDTMDFLINEFKDATPSMLQDIREGRKTELDIFAGEVIRLGEKHNIATPANKKIYKEITKLENS